VAWDFRISAACAAPLFTASVSCRRSNRGSSNRRGGHLDGHNGQWRQEARAVGHDRVVLAEFATGIHADGFHVTDGLFGQCESQPGSIERRRSYGYEPGLSPEGDELADKLSRGLRPERHDRREAVRPTHALVPFPITVTNDVAKDDMRDATLRQKRQRRDVFVAVGLPAAPVGELLQSSRAACAATIAGREPSSLNIVTIVTMSKLSDARSMAKQQSLPLLHETRIFIRGSLEQVGVQCSCDELHALSHARPRHHGRLLIEEIDAGILDRRQ